MSDNFERGMAAYRASIRSKARPYQLDIDPLVAAFLTRLIPRPDGVTTLTEFVVLFRASLRSAKQRQHATRKAVAECLERLGVPTGLTYERQRCLLGYSIAPAPTLIVNESGKIVEAA